MNKIGRYEIRATLGKGGMGVVFHAWDPWLMREVAIKFMLPELATAEALQRFVQEAMAHGSLIHEGIVTVYDRGEFDGRPYIVMEFLRGDTLESLMKQSALAIPEFLTVLRQMAAALDFAHANKIVHRDIKPMNVMVLKTGSAKIMDFGLVKADLAGFLKTVSGQLMGIGYYMSPEQYLGGEIRGSSDQWALAVVAYEGLTGTRPFRAETWPALQHQVCNVPVPASAALNVAAFSAIRKALSKEPGERYANCLSFVQELEQALAPPAGAIKINPHDGQRYLWIPPGRFRMGCSEGDNGCLSDEKPAHDVTLTRGYWLGETPVTQRAYQRVMGKNPSHFKGEDLPVENVTWNEADEYCREIGGRLPTEAEWEYAARGRTTGVRYGDLDAVAWHRGNSGSTTHPVKQKAANIWGLYDMLGNVWEWTTDWYAAIYEGAGAIDPKGPATGRYKPLRGGSWVNNPRHARVSSRDRSEPTDHSYSIGFRCVGE